MPGLNLIKSGLENVEKRVLPRFPFTSLVFRATDGKKSFEVKDISKTGMQLSLKEGEILFSQGERLKGELHWKSEKLGLQAEIIWVKGKRMGVSFVDTPKENINSFLSVKNILACLRPLHGGHFAENCPEDLKYWIMADGPVEIFVWNHRDGDIGKFQLILFDKYIEWSTSEGVKTGKVLTKRSLETPLISEDEMVFGQDESNDTKTLEFGIELIERIPENILNKGIQQFIEETLKGV